jgi:hypothetical protein
LVAHTCDLRYSGDRDGGTKFQVQPKQKKKKVGKTLSQRMSKACWLTSVMPAMKKVKVEG